MKIAYWGHFPHILKSKYLNSISYFVFEPNKTPMDLINYVQNNGLNYYFVQNKSDITNIIRSHFKPDLTIVASFGLIFPLEAIEELDRKIINIHPGILPDCRGRHPLPQAILNREKEMGLTAHVLNEEIDSGQIISIKKTDIEYNYSYKYNEKKLLAFFPQIFDESIEKFANGEIDFSPKIINEGRYYKPLSKEVLNSIINSQRLEDL